MVQRHRGWEALIRLAGHCLSVRRLFARTFRPAGRHAPQRAVITGRGGNDQIYLDGGAAAQVNNAYGDGTDTIDNFAQGSDAFNFAHQAGKAGSCRLLCCFKKPEITSEQAVQTRFSKIGSFLK